MLKEPYDVRDGLVCFLLCYMIPLAAGWVVLGWQLWGLLGDWVIVLGGVWMFCVAEFSAFVETRWLAWRNHAEAEHYLDY